MKTRMTAADVAAEVACLQAAGLHGMRVSNVYDLNARSYILKLSRSAGDGLQGQKVCPRSRSLVATIHPRAGWFSGDRAMGGERQASDAS
jgi:predicted ribosome quality control (RQC) complex YloA/Tae2 family protein